MNVTPFSAQNYDKGIREIIPYYEQIQQEVMDLIKSNNPEAKRWLDTGCGTGYLVSKAIEHFPTTEFFLCDSSAEMLDATRQRLQELLDQKGHFIKSLSQELPLHELPKMDVITAILVHHFCNTEERIHATKKCFDLLETGGIYVSVEITRPRSPKNVDIALKKWGDWELRNGRNQADVKSHLARFDSAYVPITIDEHIEILRNTEFSTYDIFWFSNVHAAFYAIK